MKEQKNETKTKKPTTISIKKLQELKKDFENESNITASKSAEIIDTFIEFATSNKVLPYARKPLNEFTWAQIAEITDKGLIRKYFKVGDTKSEELYTGEKIEIKLIDLAPHNKIANSTKNAGAAFMFTIDGEYDWNDTASNEGGWDASRMRNVYIGRFFKLLPKALQDIIKVVEVPTSAGSKSKGIIKSQDNLFLFSEVEVTGKVEYSASGEGSIYEYFKSNKLPNKWTWLRSPSVTSSFYACIWYSFGYVNFNFTTSSSRVVLGFCL